MICCMTAGSTVTSALVKVAAPVVRLSGLAASVLKPTLTPPFAPAGALWVWPGVMAVVTGNPVSVRSIEALAAGMAPAPSRVRSKATVALPLPLFSSLAIGGTSFSDLMSAVNVSLVAGVGAAVVAATVGAAVGGGAVVAAGWAAP